MAQARTYVQRAARGFAILQQLGRDGLYRIENRVSVGRLDHPGRDVFLYMDSKYAPMRIRACAKEPWTVEWLEGWLAPGDVLWDIGANVGPYALLASALTDGQTEVIAVEPAFATYASLCENVVLNGAGASVRPLNVTLGPTTGLGWFNYRDLDPGAGLHSMGDRSSLAVGFEPIYRQPVLTYRLDDLLGQFPLPRPTHVKLDVDGGELDVLRGAPETLASPLLRSIMVEVNEGESGEMIELLHGHGLELRARYDLLSVHGHWNGLFARTTEHA